MSINGKNISNKQAFQLGLLLIVIGLLSLFSNLGLGFDNITGTLILSVIGYALLRFYNKKQTAGTLWMFYGAFVMFGAAAAALTNGNSFAGMYFLGFFATGFILSYLRNRSYWWALIPGGILATLAVVAGIEENISFLDSGPVFFIGIASTFAYLYMLPNNNKRWAIYPAIAAAVLAILSSSFTGGWLFPLLLIGGGWYLLKKRADGSFAAPQTKTTPESAEDTLVAASAPQSDNAQEDTLAQEIDEATHAAHAVTQPTDATTPTDVASDVQDEDETRRSDA